MRGRDAGFSVLMACAMIAVHTGARAADRPPTHGMALDSVAVLVAGDLLAGAEIPPGKPIVLPSPVPGDTLGVLSQRIVERLRARGAVVRLSGHGAAFPNGGAPAGMDLGQQPRGAEPFGATPDSAGNPGEDGAGEGGGAPGGATPVETPPPYRGGAAGTGTLQLNVQVDGSGVTYVRRLGRFPFGTKGYERLSAMRAIATLLDPATGDVVWTRSAARSVTDIVPKGSVAYASSGSGRLNPPVPKGGTRWLEPLIVVGVVAGLVVLFYSNRN